MDDLPQPAAKNTPAWIWVLAGCGCALAGLLLLGVLSTIVLPSLLGRMSVARRARAGIDLALLRDGVERFRASNEGHPPLSLDELLVPGADGRTCLPGVATLPLDPWGHAYQYELQPRLETYRLYSFGPDGVAGGAGDDADIELANSGE